MSDKVKFSDLPFPGIPKGDPCHFRLEVTGKDGQRLVHDFLINPADGCVWGEAKELGRGLQKLLGSIKWGDDPQSALNRDVLYALTLMEKALSRDSSMVIRDRAPGLGATFTSIKVSGSRDCRQLMKALKRVSKELLRRK